MGEEQDRYVGSARVPPPAPLPTTAIPYDTDLLPPPRRRRSVLFGVGIAVVIFLVLVAGVIVGFSLKFGSPTAQAPPPPAPDPVVTTPSAQADSPRLATEQFLAAVTTGDQPTANERLCGLLKSGDSGSGSGGLNLLTGLVSYKVGEERITGPTASVDVELTVPLLGAVNFDVYLVQESGGWRVCGLGPS